MGVFDFSSLWDFSRPAVSEERFRAHLVEVDGTADLPHLLEVRTQLARSMGLQGRFEEAHAELDRVETALTDEMPVARLRYLLERGRTLRSSGEPTRAYPLFVQAWELGRVIPRPGLAVDAAHMIALVVKPSEKRPWNEAAMEYAERSGDSRATGWLGTLYNNMGWDSHEEGDYAEALALHEKCWAWHKERQTGSGERVAKWAVAKQLRFLERGVEALPIHEELLDEYAREEPGGEGFVHEEIAELKLAAGDPEGARPHFARAHELLQKYDWIEKDRIQRLADHS